MHRKIQALERSVKRFYRTVGHRTQVPRYKTPEIEHYHEMENEFLKKFVNSGDRVLELGCGFGRNIALLTGITKHLFGLDYSEKALKTCKDGCRDSALLIKADAKNVPFFNEYFDKVICMFNTFGTMPARRRVLGEAYRTLKPAGKVLLSVYSRKALHHQLDLYRKAGWVVTGYDTSSVYTKEGLVSSRFSRNELAMYLKGAGFGRISISELTPISYIAVGEKPAEGCT